MTELVESLPPGLAAGVVQLAFGLLVALAIAALFVGIGWFWSQGAVHRAFGAAGRLLNRIDVILVERIAPLWGTREPRKLRRWGRLIGLYAVSAVAGAFLPGVLGLAVLLAGLVGAVAVYRHWSWDEAARLADADHEAARALVAEDLANEGAAAVAAFVMLLVLMVFKMATMRLFVTDLGAGYTGYVLYVLNDLTSALPVFDAFEVYGLQISPGVHPQPSLGPHVAFFLRAAMDLVVIAGALQLVNISMRVAAGHDLRRQERAVVGGSAADMAAAVAQIGGRAARGQLNAIRLLEKIAAPLPREHQLFRPEARSLAARRLVELADDPARGVGMLQVARTAFLELTEIHESLNQPAEWARAQSDLGSARMAIAARLLGRARSDELTAAVSAFLDAHNYYDGRDEDAARQVAVFAATAIARKSELADEPPDALARAEALMARMYAASLDGAVAASDTALATSILSDWGAAVRRQAERAPPQSRAALYEEAFRLHRRALELDPDGVTPGADANRINLAAAIMSAAVRQEPPADRTALERVVGQVDQAQELYEAARQRLRASGDRAGAARISNDLAALHSFRAQIALPTDQGAIMDLAIAEIRDALQVFTQEAWPLEWARCQDNLGMSLGIRARTLEPGAGRNFLVEAEQCHLRALQVFSVAMTPSEAQIAERNLGITRRALQRLDDSTGKPGQP